MDDRSGRVTGHRVQMRDDLHGTGQFRLDADLDFLAEHFTTLLHRSP